MSSKILSSTTIAACSAVAIIAGAFWYRHSSSVSSSSNPQVLLPYDLVQAFQDAAQRIRSAKYLSTEEKLILYALYKQATQGDAPAVFYPSWNVMEARAKHAAWSRAKGMPSSEAATEYITLVEELLHDMDTRNHTDEHPLGGKSVSRPAMNDAHDHSIDGSTKTGKLMQAAARNDVTAMQTLLRDADVNVRHVDEHGQTALHLAADRGALEAVRFLIKHGADTRAQDDDGISVLHAAVIAGNRDICQLLLQNGADPDVMDSDGDTPRSCAHDADDDIQALFT